MKGVPDIIGHDLEGRAVYAEIKTKGDRLSQDQIDFLQDAEKRDCRVYLVREFEGFPEIINWVAYLGGA
jgi:hypothetical protein